MGNGWRVPAKSGHRRSGMCGGGNVVFTNSLPWRHRNYPCRSGYRASVKSPVCTEHLVNACRTVGPGPSGEGPPPGAAGGADAADRGIGDMRREWGVD
ncbi:hypothetical protein GCM10022205_49290 [Spinactinospora alkalitolerans]